MDKKTKGGIAGIIAAMLYGGAQLLDVEARIGALEDLHPELITEIPAEPEEAPAAPAEPPAEPPAETTDPAPEAEALKLNEDDEWIPAEEEAGAE